MTPNHQTISLGFTNQPFPPGVHVCQIFSSDEERQESLLKFISSGLESKERTTCLSDKVTEQVVEEFLGNHGISYREARDSGALTLGAPSDVYLKADRFDPESLLSMLTAYYVDSIAQGYPGVRYVGEMPSEIRHVSGGNRLIEYESKVSLLLRDYPITAVCQYDARAFEGAFIMDVLKVHPLMVVRGAVIRNPFYIKPEEFLAH